jgi:hypothetical protein
MNYVDFSAGNKEYRLRLNTRNVVALEKTLGCNPVSIFGDGDTIPSFTAMVAILHASLQQLNHGITVDKAYDIFDDWINDGNSMVDFVKVILEVYKASGIVPNTTDTTEEAVEHEKN